MKTLKLMLYLMLGWVTGVFVGSVLYLWVDMGHTVSIVIGLALCVLSNVMALADHEINKKEDGEINDG